jgi:hypothetical protein
LKIYLGSLREGGGRPAALLAQQAAPLTTPAIPRLPAAPLPAPVSMEELRQRALELVTAFFSASGRPTPQPLAVASTLLPWLRAPGAVAAGQSLAVPVSIENDQPEPVDVCLYSTDLLSDQGRSIPGYLVSFEPPSLTLGPGQKAAVRANVAVPLQSVPGSYSGLVQAQGLSAAKTVLTVEVS